MTCTLNNKMYRRRHSEIILWNTAVNTVISCNYTVKLYSCNDFQALGPHCLLREWVSYINYALCKRIFPLIHFKCCCLTVWRAPLSLCGERRWQQPAPHLHFSWLQWDRDVLRPREKQKACCVTSCGFRSPSLYILRENNSAVKHNPLLCFAMTRLLPLAHQSRRVFLLLLQYCWTYRWNSSCQWYNIKII